MVHRTQAEKEEWEALQQRSFTDRQFCLLCRLRKTYRQNWMDLPALDVRHLEFARYLVTTGRLNEGEGAQPVTSEMAGLMLACGQTLFAIVHSHGSNRYWLY